MTTISPSEPSLFPISTRTKSSSGPLPYKDYQTSSGHLEPVTNKIYQTIRGLLRQSSRFLRHHYEIMEQLIDDLIHQILGTAMDASPSPSHPTSDLDGNDALAETQGKREPHHSAKYSSAKTTATNSESQSARCQGQASTAVVDSSVPTQSGVDIANTSHATSTPSTTLQAGEIKPIPSVRYLTYRKEVLTADHGVAVFGWFLTSPEGQTTWMYIT